MKNSKPKLSVLRADLHHVGILGGNLRKTDVDELYAQMACSPLAGLKKSFELSEEAYTILDDQKNVISMFGVVRSVKKPYAGTVWLLASPFVYKYQNEFIAGNKIWLSRLHSNYDVLFNIVDDSNVTSKRWLKWMGFELLWLEQEHGILKKPFWFFAKCKNAETYKQYDWLFQDIKQNGPYE